MIDSLGHSGIMFMNVGFAESLQKTSFNEIESMCIGMIEDEKKLLLDARQASRCRFLDSFQQEKEKESCESNSSYIVKIAQ